MASVRLKDVTKIFEKNVVAVRKVNIDIQDKEFVVLVGPSGCGKSTTLRMIAGLEDVTEGEIYIGDRLVNDVPPKDRDIAMVFQNYALYPHMTVYENMAFGLKLRKYPKEEIHRRVLEAAEILGIQNLLDRKPKALSGGQRQRVAVGRAIVRKPKVFLFDEPLSNLDANVRVQMRTEISKLHQRLETTMVYVTHDQVEAMTMGDRIVVMRDGVVEQIDPPLRLYNYPRNKFVARFIGSPPMNFVDGRVIAGEDGLVFDQGQIQIRIPRRKEAALGKYVGKEVTLGIRPEHIHPRHELDGVEEAVSIDAMVDVVEPMGSEIYLYFTAGGSNFVARLPAMHTLREGEVLSLAFDMRKAHFFDKDTDQTIGLELEAAGAI
ncbi:MAG: sn-glycerol-3-phosphate ABC transporter ATP-binding protein UgpC [candidate division KSB1 bacterium]|nr:sn-glycerol-3-phosphate ABC transporter ATP-binding protein UgpC [candidate division KSB1 bacterium]